MDKTIITAFIVVVVLVLGWYLFFNNARSSFSEEETLEGTITNVDLSQTKFDGPALITIDTSSGNERLVEVKTSGLAVCPAFRNIADAFWFNVGDVIETRGEINTEGVLVPCANEEHYFRVIVEF